MKRRLSSEEENIKKIKISPQEKLLKNKLQETLIQLIEDANNYISLKVIKSLNKIVQVINIASNNGYKEIVNLLYNNKLLDNKSDLSIKNGDTLLHIATLYGHIGIAKLLLKNGVDVNIVNEHGATPLFNAAHYGHIEIVRLLLENGADVNKANIRGIAPLHMAAREGDTEVVQLLLNNGADINQADNKGKTPLHEAVDIRRTEVVKLLLDNGADVNLLLEDDAYVNNVSSSTLFSFSALYCGIYNRNTEVIKLLLENGLDINKADNNGKTPLSYIFDKISLSWFKKQFSEDNLNKSNNIFKFELLRGLYYIQKHPNIIEGNGININHYIKKIGTDCITDVFRDIKDIIILLPLKNHTNSVKILSKLKLMHNLIDQAKVDLKDQIDISSINEVYNQLIPYIQDFYNQNKDLKQIHPLKYLGVCKDIPQNNGAISQVPKEVWKEIFDYLPQKKIFNIKVNDVKLIEKELSVMQSDINQLIPIIPEQHNDPMDISGKAEELS